MPTRATRSISKKLHKYAIENRECIKTPEFNELAKFGSLLLLMGIEPDLEHTINSVKVTLNIPFMTKLTGDEISCGLYLMIQLKDDKERDSTIKKMSDTFMSTYNNTFNMYSKMLSDKKPKPSASNKSKSVKHSNGTKRDIRSSTTKRIPQSEQKNPARQVMSHCVLAERGKDILIKIPVSERANMVLEYALMFDANPPAQNVIAKNGLKDKKVLIQVSMPKTHISPRQLEQALIMIALEQSEGGKDEE